LNDYSRLTSFVAEARKYLLSLALLFVGGTFSFYLISSHLFVFIQHHLHQELVFYSVTEPFLAHVQLALSANIIVLIPVIAGLFWRAMAKPFALSLRSQIFFSLFTCFLFYSGAAFCYMITLPYGIDFLLVFQSEQLKPIISISKFVSFVTIFVLAFGLIFELPIFMVFTAKAGLISCQHFKSGRRYALLAISIIAALLTPTPDVVNMMLMAVPLYMLYEFGIIILVLLKI